MPPRCSASPWRPSRSATRPLLAGLTCCAITLLFSVSTPLGVAQEPPAAVVSTDAPSQIELRLRVYWHGGPTGTEWSGAASLGGGSLSKTVPWGSRADTPTFASDDGVTVRIAAGRPRLAGAFFVTAAGAPDSALKLELTAAGQEPFVAEVPLRDLAVKPFQALLTPAGGVLQVQRVPDDVLRVRVDRPQLIFSPGERFTFEIDATLAGFPAHSPIDLQAELSLNRGGDPLESLVERATADADGSCQGPISLTLPEAEGVYTVRLTARRPSGFMRGWGKGASKPLAERAFQVVVWDDARVTRLGSDEATVVEIEPTNSRWWLRMPEWKWTRRVPWLPKGPLGSEPAELVTVDSRKWVRLRPADNPSQANWQAYPLPIDQPGAPHLLEIEVPDATAQSLDLTLFDRDAIGRAAPLGDSLTATTGGGRGQGDGRSAVVRRLFWPKTDSPMLVVSNTGLTPALYGNVRVKSLARVLGPSSTEGERPLAASFTDAQLTQLLGATHMPWGDGRDVYEDWRCFYDTALRLADYVEHAGFNGAVVTVAAAEGTLYPTAILGGQSGLDRQLIATGVVDLPRKDLLELLLREFDRRGLRLTLAMDFCSAIPAVEAARQEGDASVDLLDPDGRGPTDSVLQYNPLNATVRRELVQAVSEVAGKCRGHKSFAGIAIRLTPRCNAALPDVLMGSDPMTVDAFLAAKQLSRPAEAPRTPSNVRRALNGALSEAWRDWRAASMTSLYGEMARAVASADPTARLHLLIDGMLDDVAGRDALRPRLEQRVNLDALLLQRGIDREMLASPPNLVVVAPRYVDLSTNLNQAALAMQQNALLWSDPSHAAPYDASTLLHSKRLGALQGFKARSPFGADKTYTSTTLQRVAFGRQASAAMTAVLSRAPVGELWEDASALPLSDEQRASRQLVRQTPAEGAPNAASSTQPLVSWSVPTEQGVCLLVSNPTGWPLKATLTLDAPEACTYRWLATDAAAGTPLARLEPGKHLLDVDLPPHGISVYRFSSRGVAVSGVRSETQADAVEELSAEVEQLGLRDLNAKLPFHGCTNLSFEEIGADRMPTGWARVDAAGAGVVASSSDDAVDGASSVSITAGPLPVKLASNAFRPPETRQLVMSFFVRTQRKSKDSSLTIRYRTSNTEDELFTTINAKTLAEVDGWRQFVFAEDLPLGPAAPMQIVFEAQNLEVSLDKLELQALSFPLDYELGGEARRQRLALVHLLQSTRTALADGRLRDCQEALDGYWAQFLQLHTPLVERKPPVIAGDNNAKQEEEAPKTSRGWKAYLPGFLR